MKIYLDFDGTVVEHQYPQIGEPNYGCLEVIKKLQDAGHEFILNSYRADCNDGTLEKALTLINDEYHKLLKNPDAIDGFRIRPIKEFTSEKIAPPNWNMNLFMTMNVLFIDDRCPGIPLKKAVSSDGWMVDWNKLDLMFEKKGIYKSTPELS